MYSSRSRPAQELPRVENAARLPSRQVIAHPQLAAPRRLAQYHVLQPYPSSPTSSPMQNGYAVQTSEVTQPVLFDLGLVTDYNTLMNGYIPPPDDYRERREAPPARLHRGFAGTSPDAASDAVWRPQSAQCSISRTTSYITSAPGSSGGGTSHTHYSGYRHQISHPLIPKIEDDSEDEASEPASTVASDLPSAIYELNSYQYESHPWPLSDRQAQATAAASQLSLARPTQKGPKKAFYKILGKLRRKRSSRCSSPTVSITASTTSAFTVSSAPRRLSPSTARSHDSGPYYADHRLNTGASVLEWTHTIQRHMTQPHPLTVAMAQAAERVQSATDTGSYEVQLLGRADKMRQFHDRQDMNLMRM